ncbi:hypothetical protein MTO96_024808 [Rhipicephalus appendiculatus]
MRYCCVPMCKSSARKKDPGVSFHEIPADLELRRQWIKPACSKVRSDPRSRKRAPELDNDSCPKKKQKTTLSSEVGDPATTDDAAETDDAPTATAVVARTVEPPGGNTFPVDDLSSVASAVLASSTTSEEQLGFKAAARDEPLAFARRAFGTQTDPARTSASNFLYHRKCREKERALRLQILRLKQTVDRYKEELRKLKDDCNVSTFLDVATDAQQKSVKASFIMGQINNYAKKRATWDETTVRLTAWLEYVGREDLWGKSMKSLRNCTVCSDNFGQHDFMNAEQNSLTKLAAPSVPPPTLGVDPLATQSAGEDEIVVDSVWVAASLKAHGYEVIADAGGSRTSSGTTCTDNVKGFGVTSTVSPGERKVRRLCDEVAEEDARPTPLSVELVGVVRPVRPSVFRDWQLSSLFGKRGDCCHHATRGEQTVRDVVAEVIVRAGVRKWFHFPWTPDEKGAFKKVSSAAGVIGCVDGSVAVIIAPKGDHHKAASYCCKKHYADIVMLVCDVDMGILS